MFCSHGINAGEVIFTAIVIAGGAVLAVPIVLTASYFVVMFS